MNPPAVRVLLVEDSRQEYVLVKSMLEKHPGFSLVWADSLAKANDLLAAHDLDIILLDLSLPDSPQPNTLAWIRSQNLPIVVVTANDEESFYLEVFEKGAKDLLIKTGPEHALLARAITHAIERFRIDRELSEYRARLEDMVLERTKALSAANADLRLQVAEKERLTKEIQYQLEMLLKFKTLAVDREQRMIELKHEVNELRRGQGLPVLYQVPERSRKNDGVS